MVRSQPTPPKPAADESADWVAELLGRAAIWVLHAAAVLGWWAIQYPLWSVPAVVCGLAALRFGWPAGLAATGLWGVLLLTWRIHSPGSFDRLLVWPVIARWRRWWVYQRRWAKILALHGLTATLDDDVVVPGLRLARLGRSADVLTVRLNPGQAPADWQKQSEALAHAFGALAVMVRCPKPGWVRLTVTHHDRLARGWRLPTPREKIDLTAVPVGVREDGPLWLLPILGRHILIAGATGAGKGSVIWAILAGLAPAIRNRVVSVRAVDPKGGMELGGGAALFDAFACDAAEAMLAVLRDAATVLAERAKRLRGHTRLHTPTVGDPLILLVIDEAATLTSYITDRKVRAEVEQLLGLILSQGRAVGVSVVAAVQDPSKDVLGMRQLFPVRVGMRLTEASQIGMVLGQGARDRGARCDEIPDTLPGIGYVAEDGTAELMRVRAFEVTDADIDWLAATYRARPVNGDPQTGGRS
jgi:DNA segregation ATPase FtsK/SpoIIIE, S-DNA-T family